MGIQCGRSQSRVRAKFVALPLLLMDRRLLKLSYSATLPRILNESCISRRKRARTRAPAVTTMGVAEARSVALPKYAGETM
jgi:hypothetical protein